MLSHLKRILTSGVSPNRRVRRPGAKQPPRRGLHLEYLEDRTTPAAAFPEFVDPNPDPGNGFGLTVVPLSTGNVVVVSPRDDAGGTDAGAAYLFNGATGALISTLLGSTANDFANHSVIALSNGNFVISNSAWDNGSAVDAGAVTWGNGTTGVSGTISAANSLVGSTAGDNVANVLLLASGNYVVRAPGWDNGAVVDVGAVTWGSVTAGVAGVVSAANSLVGSTAGDNVGGTGIALLANGNYVVRSANWDNGAAANAGAVTWGSGTTGVAGVVTAGNSLVGTTANDSVGGTAVVALANSNYVVISPNWDNGTAANAGAATWGNGAVGITGVVTAANSLVGSTANDNVGGTGLTSLTNGNYVVRSANWDNGAAANAGAVTWGSGTTGVAGVVTAANSLVGSTANDQVGSDGVRALSNGNYYVVSSQWDNGAMVDAGAVTFGNGTTGVWGTITAVNSVVGTNAVTTLRSADTADAVNGTFFARFLSEGGGRVRVGSQTTGFFPNIAVPAQTAYEDVDQPLTGISIGDGGSVTLTFTLSVSHGTLTLGSTTNLTVSGNGTASVTLIGTTADLNAALATLVYRGDLNFSGVDTLTLAAGDGFGSGLSTSTAITVRSAADQAADLQARVAALRDAGVLNGGQANSLIVKLNLHGNAGDVGKVEAFLNQVQALRSAGILTDAQADELLYWGQILLLSVRRR